MTKDLKNLPPIQRFFTLLALAASLALVVAAERDIQRRPAAELRGGKLLWRLVCLNALGAVGYFGWGRRRPSST